MAAKVEKSAGKRGRPRKYPFDLVKNRTAKRSHVFSALTPGTSLTPEDTEWLIETIRARSAGSWGPRVVFIQSWLEKRRPIELENTSSGLKAWLDAAADELKKGRGDRAAYYLLRALMATEIDLMDALYELAMEGQAKLASDKKRGPKRL